MLIVRVSVPYTQTCRVCKNVHETNAADKKTGSNTIDLVLSLIASAPGTARAGNRTIDVIQLVDKPPEASLVDERHSGNRDARPRCQADLIMGL